MIWALLIACGASNGDSGDSGSGTTEETGEWSFKVKPKKVDFGNQDVGTVASQILTVTNNGEVDLVFVDLSATEGQGVTVTPPDVFSIKPGMSEPVAVVWTPNAVGKMDGEVQLTLGASKTDNEAFVVTLEGQGQGPTMTISTTSYDFGEVNVGCSSEMNLTVTNTGNKDLQIDGLVLTGDETYTYEVDEDEASEFPWVLGPFQSRDISVEYAPSDRDLDLAVLEVEAGADTVSTAFSGEGMVDGDNTLTYTVGDRNKATILVHVNEVAIDGPYGTYSQLLEDSLPTFFQTMLDNRADYRVVFFWSVDGTVDGNTPYLDNTFSASESAAIALDMIAGGGNAGDNDRNFTSLMNAIVEQEDWLFEDDNWAESKLSLVAINRDVEQSGGNYAQYVSDAQAYKEDPEQVVFHAIAGPLPRGCGSAEPFTGFADAVTLTGGVFLSVCEPDWLTNMEQLAAACMDGADFFPLTGEPLVTSIKVKVDDFTTTTGWEYDEDLNAVVFDEATYPSNGAEVEIYYLKSDSCG